MKHIIKKITAVLFLMSALTVLSACGGSDDTIPSAENLRAYDGGNFTIQIDPAWKIINQSDFYAEIPKETLVAFASPEAYNGFFINVNIIREPLNQNATSIDYGRANINASGQNLVDYQKIQEVDIDLNGESALLHIFQARLNASEKLIRFIQLYVAQGQTGYIVSGGMPPDTPQELRDLVGAMVTSFRLK